MLAEAKRRRNERVRQPEDYRQRDQEEHSQDEAQRNLDDHIASESTPRVGA